MHSIAASLFLQPEEMHFFHDIGYRHEPFQHCPQDSADKCYCNPKDGNNFEFHWYSCTPKWKEGASPSRLSVSEGPLLLTRRASHSCWVEEAIMNEQRLREKDPNRKRKLTTLREQPRYHVHACAARHHAQYIYVDALPLRHTCS